MTLLSIQNLSVAFKECHPVKSASLIVNKGEWVALIGASGCGKTTVARTILKLQQNAHIQGSIQFQGQELLTLSEPEMQNIRGGKIAMIFQEPMSALNPLQTIQTQIMESLKLHHNTPSLQHIYTLLQQVELKNPKRIATSYPHQLSGGERQRAVIAMALAGNPQLLIADEPTTALDSQTQNQILILLQKLQHDLNLSILFITHDIDLAQRFSNRIYTMQKGQIQDNQIPKLPDFGTPVIHQQQTPLVLDVQNLQIRYGTHLVIQDFSFQLHQGETVALLGESGSGKSSIGQALVRLVDASGQVLLNGQNFLSLKGKELKNARASIQMVFQDPFSSLNPRWTIQDIILEGGKIHHLTNLSTLLMQTLNSVHLAQDILSRYPHELSGGQRVRVALARALILKPQVLILDEITTQLDIQTQTEILKLLKELQQNEKLAYLFISHDQRVINALAHKIIRL